MTLQSEHFMKYRNAGVYAEKLKMTYCGVDCCKECRRIGDCGGCEACKGHPFGGSCVTERNEHFSALKKQLIDEINALHMEELEITDLFCYYVVIGVMICTEPRGIYL